MPINLKTRTKQILSRTGWRIQAGRTLVPVINYSDDDNQVVVQLGDSPLLDAFGRLRVSEPVGRFDAQFTYDLQPLLYEQLTDGGAATIVHDATERAALLTLNDSGHAYMQSYKHIHYYPGNSHLARLTFNFRGHKAAVTKIVGYGDRANNGIHFISDGEKPAWRILSDTSLGDETVIQTDWNLDTLDGSNDDNNPSGVGLDVGKVQIAVIDLQALYTGRVRVGFNVRGQDVFCHEFRHANISAFPYIQSASLPIIAGMQCPTATSTTMLFICATVRSEGASREEEGFNFGVEGTVEASSGARTHVLSIRPKATFNSIANRINFVLESIEIIVTGNNSILWELCVGQAISGTTAFNDVNSAYSGFEYNTAGTISGNPAIVVSQGYAAGTAANKSIFSSALANRYPITLDAAGATRALGTLSLTATGLGGNSAMRASLNWREIR